MHPLLSLPRSAVEAGRGTAAASGGPPGLTCARCRASSSSPPSSASLASPAAAPRWLSTAPCLRAAAGGARHAGGATLSCLLPLPLHGRELGSTTAAHPTSQASSGTRQPEQGPPATPAAPPPDQVRLKGSQRRVLRHHRRPQRHRRHHRPLHACAAPVGGGQRGMSSQRLGQPVREAAGSSRPARAAAGSPLSPAGLT